MRVEGRAALPGLVADLVSREVPVYGAVPRPPTVEDIYFALQEREEVVLRERREAAVAGDARRRS